MTYFPMFSLGENDQGEWWKVKHSPEDGSKNCGKLETGNLLPGSESEPDQVSFPHTEGGGPGNIWPAKF